MCPSKDTSGDGTTTLTDFVSVSNGTLTNMDAATDWVSDTGSGGTKALDFDGTNDHVLTANTPSAAAKCAALMYWFKRPAINTTAPGLAWAGAANDNTTRFSINVFSDGNVYIVVGATAFGFFATNDTNWHSLAVNFNGNGAANSDRLKAYLDGVEVTLTFSGSIPSTLPTAASSRVIIGAVMAPTLTYGSGRVDDVRAMLRIATAGEIAEVSATRGGTYTTVASGKPQHPMTQQVIG
jgi:hypothetical protein